MVQCLPHLVPWTGSRSRGRWPTSGSRLVTCHCGCWSHCTGMTSNPGGDHYFLYPLFPCHWFLLPTATKAPEFNGGESGAGRGGALSSRQQHSAPGFPSLITAVVLAATQTSPTCTMQPKGSCDLSLTLSMDLPLGSDDCLGDFCSLVTSASMHFSHSASVLCLRNVKGKKIKKSAGNRNQALHFLWNL